MQTETPGAHTAPNDARAALKTPCRARSAAPATQNAAPATQNASRKARSPHCTKRRQDDARAYIRPLVEPEVPRLPRKMQAERPGAHTAPNDARTTPGRRQGVHQTPWKAPEVPPAPATQNASRKARSPGRRQDDARAYIRPLGKRQVPRLPRKMQADRPGAHTAPNDARTTPGRTSDPLYSQKCRACHAKCKQKGPEPTLHQTTPGRRQDDARAYIRPLVEPEVPRLPRKMQAERPGAHTAPNDARTTPGRRQGVHQTPWKAPSTAPATQNASRKARSPHCTKRRQDDARTTPGRTSDRL